MEKPILFSGPMVRAILEGRKSQTRRVVKPEPAYGVETCPYSKTGWGFTSDYGCSCRPAKPTYQPGDVLWVRETWAHETEFGTFTGDAVYRADGDQREREGGKPTDKWRPSIFMPKSACRLFLKVKAVRAEHLQDISEEDAMAEGVEYPHVITMLSDMHKAARVSFRNLWDSINGKKNPWASNPWVWVIEFERVR